MVDWSSFTDAEVLAFAATIAGVARELARTVPAPRGAPLFGLDMALVDPLWLDRFSRHGIFRKYQRAASLDSGLGGVPRWWATHFGCSVASFDPHPGVSEAAERLGAPSVLAARTTFRAAPPHNLPVRAEQFTHVWSVDGLAAVADRATVLREALRVLRPSGMLSAIIGGHGAEDPSVRDWSESLAGTGFIAIAVRALPPPELPHTVLHAEHVLRAAIGSAFRGPQRTRLLQLAADLEAARSNRAARVIIFAEKPS